MTDRAPSPPPLPSSEEDPAHPRTRYRGAFRISLAISALIHLAAIALYPSFFSGIPEASLRFGDYAQPAVPQGTELVNLRELPADQAQDVPDVPQEELEVRPPEMPDVSLPIGRTDPGEVEEVVPGRPGLTAAERLRPRGEDLRFWAPVDPEKTAPTPEQVMRLRFLAHLEALNDSAAAAAKAAAEVADWTYTDEEGRKWGISPGKLHLGDLTLPLPSFGTSSAQRERAQDRLWAWDEIERGAAVGAVRRNWKERDQEIRERMNRERRARETKPDTTRSGGGR